MVLQVVGDRAHTGPLPDGMTAIAFSLIDGTCSARKYNMGNGEGTC